MIEEKYILTNLNPLTISINLNDGKISYVLNNYLDDGFIKFIKDSNLQIGDDVLQKQIELNGIKTREV